MRKLFLVDLFNLFLIAVGYMLLITLVLFSFDLFEIETTGSLFLNKLSSATVISLFNNEIFNGLFTLFFVISVLIFLYKAIDLYKQNR
ncbi:hypothetical protein NGH74_03820 [Staphylococcus pseudoxylosus]|uniref:hypothetical protein n=1 Tax=Staphylococcus pseudoxylosus TaxID=2282419 RepID=UPI000D1D49DC|nr:hypothetical protein [Staphylococcus pseudoxylosus]PTI44861.1 hypothetical protein BU120_07420 [Staphylococcus xylosus]MDW8797823.1 hypothetical protein [Staphylococcus pseudoxylosus]MEB6036891.1 hypothetical protein [Staphylococcus pseudoxylosus]MEB7764622.1 hypothetical protein [Staphylococcus pseudoxylosus]MEB8086293.1 hypothetical protein [Staphylococcus pseudoxylosus]